MSTQSTQSTPYTEIPSSPTGNGRSGAEPRDGGEAANPSPVTRHASPTRGQRILIHAPPQYGKSILVSKRFPAWALGVNPYLRIVLAGYNLEHAAAFAEVVREIGQSPAFRQCFPWLHSNISKGQSRYTYSTRARRMLQDGQDSMTAVGLLSGFTGKGADILIIDDPYASPDDARSSATNERVWRWWTELAKVRINDDTNVLVMFHRYHEDDLAGRLLAEGGWTAHDNSPDVQELHPVHPVHEVQEASADEYTTSTSSTSSTWSTSSTLSTGSTSSTGSTPSIGSTSSTQSTGSTPSTGSISSTQPAESGNQSDSGGESRDSGTSRPNQNNDLRGPGERSSPGPRKWSYFRFPAIADENEDGSDPTGRAPGQLLSPMRSREFLADIQDREPQVWLSQFQGRPRPPEGAFIQREWLKTTPASAVPPLDLWVRFWDLATTAEQKGDFTAGALVGVGPDQTLYVRDVTRFRAEWPDACQIIADTTERDSLFCSEAGAKYAVGLEKVAWMRAMTQDLMALPAFKSIQLWPVPPNGDKKERASGWVARAKYDRLRLVLGPWNTEFISECLSFDGLGSVHDDQVDSVSGAYALVWDLRGAVVEQKPPVIEGSYEYYKLLGELNKPPDYDDDWPSAFDDD